MDPIRFQVNFVFDLSNELPQFRLRHPTLHKTIFDRPPHMPPSFFEYVVTFWGQPHHSKPNTESETQHLHTNVFTREIYSYNSSAVKLTNL